MSTYHEEAGKGSHRRTEDREAIKSNWDKIDWSKKENKDSGCSTTPEDVPVGD
jgi:hypothetical protein